MEQTQLKWSQTTRKTRRGVARLPGSFSCLYWPNIRMVVQSRLYLLLNVLVGDLTTINGLTCSELSDMRWGSRFVSGPLLPAALSGLRPRTAAGQFFVSFVIHLQTKLELFILQRNVVLFPTARFVWREIAQAVAPREIKIQLFLKFRWHDPIGLWYIISHFYYLNWEGFHKVAGGERGDGGRGGDRNWIIFCNLKNAFHCDSAVS